MSKNRGQIKSYEDFALFWRACKTLWQICPQYIFWQILNGIVEAIVPYFGAYMSARIINELAGNCDKNYLLILASITVLGGFVISVLSRIVRGRLNVWQHNGFLREELFFLNVQNRMRYKHLENSEVAFLREKIFSVKNANGGGLLQVQWTIPSILANITRIITSLSLSVSIFKMSTNENLCGFLKFANSPWAILSLVVLTISQAIISIQISNVKSTKTAKEWEQLAKSNTRYMAYNRIWGSDTYIFNMKKIILPEQEKHDIHPQFIVNANKICIKYNIASSIVSSVVNLWLFTIVAAKAFIGVWGIGNFVLYQTTIERMMDSVTGLACDIGRLRFNSKYLIQLYEFLDLGNEMDHDAITSENLDNINGEIEFCNVSFKYPGTDIYVLKNINVKFNIGDKLAIVGENGSGKTTFIKLLCRLYEPTEGKIFLNGRDISHYSYEEYQKYFSVVFQDYKLFSFSFAANVSGEHKYNSQKVKDCLARVGLGEKIEELEKGIETALHCDYENDGIELSGGEEQKIALARALYKDSQIFILDEPTAALDPIAESEIYANFSAITENKTLILVSHRLSACNICEDILIFDHGSIIQRGSHDKLVKEKEGKYYQLWNSQAKYYT